MRVLVVGSGAAGVHFAQTALERGHAVDLIDVGHLPPVPAVPNVSFPGLPEALADPSDYFLGADGSHAVLPTGTPSFYGFPPSKGYVFRRLASLRDSGDSFQPMQSLARGGLAEAWTGGSYEYGPADLARFGFDPSSLVRAYDTVACRVGIAGEADDLERFSPRTARYQTPLALDPHSARLVERYRVHRSALHAAGFRLGRSRVAVLSEDRDDRRACTRLGRCLWGCPGQSLYAPSATLRQLQRREGFRYLPGRVAMRLETDEAGVIRHLVAERVDDRRTERYTADLFVLAAGALGSSRIYLASAAARGDSPRLGGLLDNRMAMVPFLSPSMIGHRVELADYQFHMLAFGIEAREPDEHAHGQITTLKAASIHPIVQNLPLDLRTATRVFGSIRAGLAVATLWIHDRRDDGNFVELVDDGSGVPALRMVYREAAWHRAHLSWALGRLRHGLGRLGALVPRSMTRVLPHGASVHYGGTLPMAADGGPDTLTLEGRSRRFMNLVVADAAGFPFLPAKNHTFTLMANAVRIAEAVLP